MILKSALRDLIQEALTDHDVEDVDLVDDLADRIGGVLDVMDDEEENEG